jgi:hypothetical protein
MGARLESWRTPTTVVPIWLCWPLSLSPPPSHVSLCLSRSVSLCLSVCLSACLSVCLSFSLCHAGEARTLEDTDDCCTDHAVLSPPLSRARLAT